MLPLPYTLPRLGFEGLGGGLMCRLFHLSLAIQLEALVDRRDAQLRLHWHLQKHCQHLQKLDI